METIIFVGLAISGLLLLFVLPSSKNTKQDGKDKKRLSPAIPVRPFYNMKMEFKLADNGGTRLGIDRRKFHYTAYIPEKRSGMDRRKGFDRRRIEARRTGAERRSIVNTP